MFHYKYQHSNKPRATHIYSRAVALLKYYVYHYYATLVNTLENNVKLCGCEVPFSHVFGTWGLEWMQVASHVSAANPIDGSCILCISSMPLTWLNTLPSENTDFIWTKKKIH